MYEEGVSSRDMTANVVQVQPTTRPETAMTPDAAARDILWQA